MIVVGLSYEKLEAVIFYVIQGRQEVKVAGFTRRFENMGMTGLCRFG